MMPDDLHHALNQTPYPFQNHIGMRIADWSHGYARVDLPLTAVLMNRQGIPHGGVLATLLDTAMGFCGCYTGDTTQPQYCVTLSITVNYLAQAKGQMLTAEGHRIGGGRKTFYADAAITDETGDKIATASGVFRYIRPPQED